MDHKQYFKVQMFIESEEFQEKPESLWTFMMEKEVCIS